MSTEYDNYLREHINAVDKAAHWIVNNTPAGKDLPSQDAVMLVGFVGQHDSSKFSPEEYDAYDAYFYGEKDDGVFSRAWLHHIHNNPHHWQHWMLMNDDGKYRDPGKVMALEMPKVYALEMIADWWSFSWRSGNLHEVFDWYESHKDNIVLHESTRMYVESVLDEIREALEEAE